MFCSVVINSSRYGKIVGGLTMGVQAARKLEILIFLRDTGFRVVSDNTVQESAYDQRRPYVQRKG